VKKFDYRYSILQTGALTNSDGTKIKRKTSRSGFEIYDNSWDRYLEDAIVPEITYTATNATSVDKTVKAWTFYCDSMSGCDSSSPHYKDGDGSKGNPWRSLKYALEQIGKKMTCWRENSCYCFRKGKYFQLKVKGAIDYSVNFGDSSFRGEESVNNQWVQQFVISPWEDNKIVFDAIYTRHIYGTIFNNIQLNEGTEIYGSGNCIFNHTTVNSDANFNSCHGTRFIDMNYVSESYNTQRIFSNCQGSDLIGFTGINKQFNGVFNRMRLYNAHITINDTSNEYYKTITGFYNFNECQFYNCSANVSGTLNCYYNERDEKYYGYVDAVGFYGNTNCTFYNCSMTNSCQKCSGNPGWQCRTPDF